MARPTENPSAISVESYIEFIATVLDAKGGRVKESELDDLIFLKYSPLWGKTDKEKWGKQKHPKWVQNVASAKSVMDRNGTGVKYVEEIPVEGKSRPKRIIWRVKLPPPFFCYAWATWYNREIKGRKKYKQTVLVQPDRVHIVPKLD